MQKLRLMTLVGTRPEIIKMSSIIKKCDKYFDHIIVHTGQNFDYKLNQVFFEELGIREPDFYLGVVGENLGQTMGNVISKSYEIMIQEKPDAVIMLGDTNSCLAVISAKRLKIPIFHMEAGNRCKDENLPEEVIRRIVDTTSDINLCYSENARYHLLSSGSKPEYTFVVGSPMLEVLSENFNSIKQSKILEGLKLIPKEFILLSAHREENIDNDFNFFSLMKAINQLATYVNKTIIYSCHPRSKKKITESGFEFHPNVKLHEPFGFWDYIKLQENSYCVISDSGTLPEESAILHFPGVSLRTSTERPEAIDSGVFIIGSISGEAIIQAVEMAVTMSNSGDISSIVHSYNDSNVSTKVAKIILSYSQIVNKMIWRK